MEVNPIGAAARTFLRRVQLAGEPLHAEPDELQFAEVCTRAGYLQPVHSRLGTFEITPRGISYLSALARSH